jgi:tubulin epsilon
LVSNVNQLFCSRIRHAPQSTMPRELITISVGQCGLQLGLNFWELALQEHANYSTANNSSGQPLFDDSMSSFFRNIDEKSGADIINSGNSPNLIRCLKARSVLIDMECGVLDELSSSRNQLSTLFDNNLTVKSTDGSGNNWSVGYEEYGKQYGEAILSTIQKALEQCDSIQAFLLIHSLGGGTGSGLGSFIVELLASEYPEIYRFVTSVAPDPDVTDVVTAPYNQLLANNILLQHADAVLTVDNGALQRIHSLLYPQTSNNPQNPLKLFTASKKQGFSGLNYIAGEVLCGLTASMRFPGQLNTDLNEITMNLVPFPDLKFLIPAISPITAMSSANPTNLGNNSAQISNNQSIDALFTGLLHANNHLLTVPALSLRQSSYLAFGLLCRGKNLSISHINRGVSLIKNQISLVKWNQDGFKTGLCSVNNARNISTGLGLINSTVLGENFANLAEKFSKLYRYKAHFFHYEKVLGAESARTLFNNALDNIKQLESHYNAMKYSTLQQNSDSVAPSSKNNQNENRGNSAGRYIPAI